jgi:hypothetical protein
VTRSVSAFGFGLVERGVGGADDGVEHLIETVRFGRYSTRGGRRASTGGSRLYVDGDRSLCNKQAYDLRLSSETNFRTLSEWSNVRCHHRTEKEAPESVMHHKYGDKAAFLSPALTVAFCEAVSASNTAEQLFGPA